MRNSLPRSRRASRSASGLRWSPGELTEWELAKARELKETKYTTDEWNRKPGKRE